MRESQFDESCALRQIAISWAIQRLYVFVFFFLVVRGGAVG